MPHLHVTARFRAAAAWSADRVGIWAPWIVFLALMLLSMWTPPYLPK